MNNFVDYTYQTERSLPALGKGKMYGYITGANGIFVYSKNQYFEALIPVRLIKHERDYVRGLEIVQPMFKIIRKIKHKDLRTVLDKSRKVLPLEALFYFVWSADGWSVRTPQQYQTQKSVTPKMDDGGYVPVEIHSHNTMDAFFSATDNADETGLRVYGVLGHVDQPVVDIKMRISIYGHRAIVPYSWVFENYYEVRDAKA